MTDTGCSYFTVISLDKICYGSKEEFCKTPNTSSDS